ncbi:MAG: four helix bundle protein [Gemmatimonadales bacterium]
MGYFKDLTVWQTAHRLALAVYQATGGFPPAERFGLTAQARRAAVSVAANLAEGAGRRSDAELVRFAGIALGSLHELEAELLLARDLGWLNPGKASSLETGMATLGRSIAALQRRLRTTGRSPRRSRVPASPDSRQTTNDQRPPATD